MVLQIAGKDNDSSTIYILISSVHSKFSFPLHRMIAWPYSYIVVTVQLEVLKHVQCTVVKASSEASQDKCAYVGRFSYVRRYTESLEDYSASQ